MNKRTIAGTTLSVSPIALGTGEWGIKPAGETLAEIVDVYAVAGGNFIDTAHCYAFWRGATGISERTVGDVVRSRFDRDTVVVSTKCGHPDGGEAYRRLDDYLGAKQIDLDVAESIERLGLGPIDLLFAHRDDLRKPAGEILEALNRPVQSGAVRYLGASNWSAARIAEANDYAAAHGLAGFVASQPQWSLASPNVDGEGWDRTARTVTADDRAWYSRQGMTVMAYTPTARGYFSAAEGASTGPFDNAESRARRERATQLGNELGATGDVVALAWLMSQPFPTIPILGTSNPEHLRIALGAAKISLTPDQACWLENGE